MLQSQDSNVLLRNTKRKMDYSSSDSNLCRLCLIKTSSVFQLYDDGVEDEAHPIHGAIKKFFDIEIKRDDLISSRICINCWNNVDNFQRFHRMVMDKQIELRNIKVEPYALAMEKNAASHHYMSFENEALVDINKIVDLYGENKTAMVAPLDKFNSKEINFGDILQGESARTPSIKSEPDSDSSHFDEDSQTDPEQGESGSSLEGAGSDTSGDGPSSIHHDNNEATSSKVEGKQNTAAQKKADDGREEGDKLIADHVKMLCDLCSEEKSSFKELMAHYRSQHRKRMGYVMCCNKRFFHYSRLLTHVQKYPDSLKCRVCGQVFKTMRTMRKHQKDTHQMGRKERDGYKCSYCERTYANEKCLKKHLENRHANCQEEESSTNECVDCKKIFPTKAKLNLHFYTTCSKLDKLCELCGETRRGEAALREHMILHDPELKKKRREQCPICKNWYADKLYVKRHIKDVHERPLTEEYKCHICGENRKSRVTLRNHIKMVHNKDNLTHECHICHKIFNTLRFLKEHKSTHTGEFLYHCPYCPAKFHFTSNYTSHRKKSHPTEYAVEQLKRQKNEA